MYSNNSIRMPLSRYSGTGTVFVLAIRYLRISPHCMGCIASEPTQGHTPEVQYRYIYGFPYIQRRLIATEVPVVCKFDMLRTPMHRLILSLYTRRTVEQSKSFVV